MKALSLLSGGLDSTLAIRMVLDQGIDVETSDGEKGGSVRISNRRLPKGSIHITLVNLCMMKMFKGMDLEKVNGRRLEGHQIKTVRSLEWVVRNRRGIQNDGSSQKDGEACL